MRLFGCTLRHYTHHGALGHEIVFVHEVQLRNPALAGAESFMFREDSDQALRGEWRALSAFREDGDALFPDGLLELLDPPRRPA